MSGNISQIAPSDNFVFFEVEHTGVDTDQLAGRARKS